MDRLDDRSGAETQEPVRVTWRRRLRDYLLGAGSVVDPLPRTPDRELAAIRIADEEAFAADWMAVGGDMRRAIGIVHAMPPADTEPGHVRTIPRA